MPVCDRKNGSRNRKARTISTIPRQRIYLPITIPACVSIYTSSPLLLHLSVASLPCAPQEVSASEKVQNTWKRTNKGNYALNEINSCVPYSLTPMKPQRFYAVGCVSVEPTVFHNDVSFPNHNGPSPVLSSTLRRTHFSFDSIHIPTSEVPSPDVALCELLK